MKRSTKINKSREQYVEFNSKSRKCPICKTFFKEDSCKHTHDEAADYLFIEYTNAIFGGPLK